MSDLITISGVRGYVDENGTAYLNLEDCARGLGFTETKGDYIRWQRVEGYLAEFGFSTSGERPEFIPENIFYRLAMKAKNETAEKFQAKVADEILPAIRKTGSYNAKPLSKLEILVQSAQALLDHERAIKQLSAAQNIQASRIEQLENKIEKRCTDDFLSQLVTPAQIGKMFEPSLSAQAINAKLRDAGLQWKVGGEWVATVEGKKYSSSEPIQLANGKMIYQLKWQRKVKDLIA